MVNTHVKATIADSQKASQVSSKHGWENNMLCLREHNAYKVEQSNQSPMYRRSKILLICFNQLDPQEQDSKRTGALLDFRCLRHRSAEAVPKSAQEDMSGRN